MYPYDDLQQRTAVRAALNQDTAMQQLPGGRDLIVAQESEILQSGAVHAASGQPRLRHRERV